MDARESWRIDPERSELRFSIGHVVLGEIQGRFDCWGGSILLDRTRPSQSTVRIWVDLSSVNTGLERRDRYILTTELFDTHEEPGLVFDSARVEITRLNHGIVAGRLSVRSFGQDIEVGVEAETLRRDDAGRPRAIYAACASIDRLAIGLRRKRGIRDWLGERVLGRTIQISAHIEATPENAAASALGGSRPQARTEPALAPS
jgi:polyisoprenoid-binding protein YceI